MASLGGRTIRPLCSRLGARQGVHVSIAKLRTASTRSSGTAFHKWTKWAGAAGLTLGLAGGSLAWMDGHPTVGRTGPKVNVYDIPLGDQYPHVVPCFVEVARGSRNKYEWDNDSGFLQLDRVLFSAVFYPHNYGFIPQTLCDDGDPLDVLLIGGSELLPGSIVDARIIGYMTMEDEKGMDEKVLAVVKKDPRYKNYRTLRDIPDHLLREITHFFETYKALETKKWSKVGGWRGTADTLDLIERSHKKYLEKKKTQPATAK